MNIHLDIQLLESQLVNLFIQNDYSHITSQKLQRILKSKPHRKARIYSSLGNLHAKNNNFTKAHQKFKIAFIINDPNFPDIKYYWARVLFGENKLEEARLELSPYLTRNSSDVDGFRLMTNICSELGLVAEADKAYCKLSVLDPKSPQLFEGWACARYFLGDFETARQYLLKALRIDPKASEAYRMLGYIFLSEERNQEAIDCFKKALGIEGSCALTWFNWSLALLVQDKEEEAMGKFLEGLEFLDNGESSNNKKDIIRTLKGELEFQEQYVATGRDEQRKRAFKTLIKSLKKIIFLLEQDAAPPSVSVIKEILLEANREETIDI